MNHQPRHRQMLPIFVDVACGRAPAEESSSMFILPKFLQTSVRCTEYLNFVFVELAMCQHCSGIFLLRSGFGFGFFFPGLFDVPIKNTKSSLIILFTWRVYGAQSWLAQGPVKSRLCNDCILNFWPGTFTMPPKITCLCWDVFHTLTRFVHLHERILSQSDRSLCATHFAINNLL